MTQTINRQFRDFEGVIAGIAKYFMKSMRSMQQKRDAFSVRDPQRSNAQPTLSESLVTIVSASLQDLDGLQRDMIENEFFNQEFDGWWFGKMSRATFYRLKRSSMECFLRGFFDKAEAMNPRLLEELRIDKTRFKFRSIHAQG